MKLNTYLMRSDVDRQKLAEKLGVHPDTLYKWERGDRTPRKAMMARIAEETGGLVMPADFFELPSQDIQAAS